MVHIRISVAFLLVLSSMLILTGQNVGIGTTTPQGEFHVTNLNQLSGPVFTGIGLDDLVVSFDPEIEVNIDLDYTIVVDNAGPNPNLIDIFFFEDLIHNDLSMSNSGIVLGGGLSIGFESLTGHTFGDQWLIKITPGDLNQLIVKEDKVGIGTAAPNHTLDVNGDFNFSGDLYKDGNLQTISEKIDDLNDGANNGSNLFLGVFNGLQNTGVRNLFVGNYAGQVNTSGNDNVYLGFGAGQVNQGSGNVFIGHNVYSLANESNRLKIHNAGATRPLIYGEFDNKKVFINRNSSISSQEVFGVSRDVGPNEYGGMYVETRGASNSFPFYGFAIDGAGKAWFEFNGNTNNIGVQNFFNGNFSVLNNNASKPTAGSWLANSDARLKKDIRSLDSKAMLEKVRQMRGVQYLWDDNVTQFERPREKQIGFIAQDLEKVWPEKVTRDHQGYLMTAYGDYDPVFVEAIKALYSMVEKQADEIEILKKEVENLRREQK